eukprot:scaffold106936_cov63-Attheya_sp.AAC.1
MPAMHQINFEWPKVLTTKIYPDRIGALTTMYLNVLRAVIVMSSLSVLTISTVIVYYWSRGRSE